MGTAAESHGGHGEVLCKPLVCRQRKALISCFSDSRCIHYKAGVSIWLLELKMSCFVCKHVMANCAIINILGK